MSTLRTFAGEGLYCRATESAGGKLAKSYGEDVVKLDCYAVLGLSPTAEDVVIRAAYLALMRSYHPDRNGSPEAAARARAITEAYKTIGDPARRAEYDASRWEHQYEILGYDEGPGPPSRSWPKMRVIRWPKMPLVRWPKMSVARWPKAPVISRPKAPVIGTVAASALTIVLAVMILPLAERGQLGKAPTRTTESAADKPVATETAAANPLRITKENRPSAPVASASPRLEEASPQPVPTSLATGEKAVASRTEPGRAIADQPIPVKVEVPPKRMAEESPPAAARRVASRQPPEVDQKARIAALQGMATSFYNQSVQHADAASRSQLQQARDLFVNSRNACRSDSCIGDAHVAYIRDMSRIMTKPKPANP